jgi:recombination protein RecA
LVHQQITKDFGNVFSTADELLEEKQEIISICPSIDRALGGGVTKGSWIVLNGVPKGGKSSLALFALAKMQKFGMKTYYLNCEGRLKSRDIEAVSGLDKEGLTVISSTEDNILSVEKWLSIADNILHQRNVALVIDSFSVLNDESKLLEFNKQTRGSENKVVSAFCSKLATVVPLKKNIVMGITHIISNTSGFGASKVEKTANALAYQADYKLQTTWAEKWTVGTSEDSEQIGQITHWKVLCSALRGPGRSAKTYIRYGSSIDEIYENVQFAIEFGMISKAGAWMSIFPDTEYEQKFQGIEKVCDFFRQSENSKLYDKLSAEVRELIV